MQPYFLPYIGYFQLIAAVDIFVIYDNIKFTKKGWINRNRMLRNGEDVVFSLPLRSDSDSRYIVERQLAAEFNREKLLSQIAGAYRCAPYFSQTFPLIKRIVSNGDSNLFNYIHSSVINICRHLGITTDIRISSDIGINHELKNQEKVISLCQAVGADIYINAIGGIDLYSKDEFKARGVELKFMKSKPFEYAQFGNKFVPWLSIVDVMMFVGLDDIRECLMSNYELI